MKSAKFPATKKVLEKANLTVGDMDFAEVKEAFATQALAVGQVLEIANEKQNVNGGAVWASTIIEIIKYID